MKAAKDGGLNRGGGEKGGGYKKLRFCWEKVFFRRLGMYIV
jgi:hypothetical protein